jgi:DNA polymerase IV
MARSLPWGKDPPQNGTADTDTVQKERPLRGDFPKSLGKRKRGQEDDIKLAPPNRRIFEDLIFYFFPNSDISPARNAKIRKAIEYGASWSRDWNQSVTHAVFDRDMPFDALLKFLKLESIPVRAAVKH